MGLWFLLLLRLEFTSLFYFGFWCHVVLLFVYFVFVGLTGGCSTSYWFVAKFWVLIDCDFVV